MKGESGIGKSTLLKLIAGLDRNFQGDIAVQGKKISKLSDFSLSRFRNETIGFVIQESLVIDNYSVLENILVPAVYAQKAKKIEALTHANELMASLNISDIQNKKGRQLSLGQRQRVAIARALVLKPEIILADEPTSSVDEKNQERILSLLMALKKQGTGIVIASHDKQVLDIADKKYKITDKNIVSVSHIC
ncbi:ABC transporter ATP-binding protein [Lactococcus insecticola]|uniref:ABC transporter ATP-binding protein n=1 Tax=Pseudolactococcus insecticola TaxID=2709158 RepID=UPI001554AF19|nr:ATP-binding cassette domain-containing protein [Lactococcus insecticola]